MKYKKGDLILVCHDGKSFLHYIVDVEPEWTGNSYLMVYLDGDHDNAEDLMGAHMLAPSGSTDQYAHVKLAFDKIDTWKLDEGGRQHKCHCDKFQVVHFGCKCGGC